MDRTEELKKVDRYAQIAAEGINTLDKQLVSPQLRKPFDRALPLGLVENTGKIFQCNRVEEEVQEQLIKLRSHYTPFLENHAPKACCLRKRIALEEFQWRIATPEDERNFLGVLQGQGEWEKVVIPHYGGPLGKAETIYRTSFELKEQPGEEDAVFIHFQGVDYIAKVFVNGRFVGMHEGFFAPFEFECKGCVQVGTNIVVVCVENDFRQMGNDFVHSPEAYRNARKFVTGDKIYAATGPGYDDSEVGWHHCPPGMGIYQEVYVEVRSRRFLGDLYVRPLTEEGQAEVHLDAYSCDPGERKVSFKISVYGRNFKETVVEEFCHIPVEGGYLNGTSETPLYLEKGINFFKTLVPMGKFRLWEPDTPWLYEAQAQMYDEDGTLLDVKTTTFGMRTFEMDTVSEKKGMMYLNGKKILLRGANTMGFEQLDIMRGDMDQLVEDILLAKACNMNFLRITQRPVQDAFYCCCDMMGMLIQTDLPLFAVLRRNQFAEAVRQAGEMERLVRSHPCVIMDTYINEPNPNAMGLPHRCLEREQLLAFFEAADRMVHLENPDRVTKHVDGDYDPPCASLPDNHCYTEWYNGHGVDTGALHKGDWLKVKPGWCYGCGEFGAEGLEDLSVMKKYYPREWLPQSKEEEEWWTPERIVMAQSGSFHYFFYETPHSLTEWIERSQKHQAEATKWMTEAFRRNKDMVSIAIHLFIDAFPAGWMKSIVDVDRNAKPAFYAYRNALTPTMVSLRTDRLTYFPGDLAKIELWLCNDRPEKMTGLTCAYEIQFPDGSLRGGCQGCEIEGSDAAYVGEVQITMPELEGTVWIKHVLLDEKGNVLHRNNLEIRVFAVEKKKENLRLYTPNPMGVAAQLIQELQEEITREENASCILIDDYTDYDKNRVKWEKWISEGNRLIFLELPAGNYELCGRLVKVTPSSTGDLHFVSRDTGHPWVQGFQTGDFRKWYGRKEDRITPILRNTFQQEDMAEVLTSGNTLDGVWNGRRGKVLAVGEMNYGKGSVVFCELRLAGHVQDNPVAWIFAKRMLTIK